ncbi:beta-ketoacyl synthase chain length factor [Azospirillum sp. TSO35-2]|uniref:beta-ketoacyl synthase chain length factor n=1 Tax=Azospirillum sp. TSO35-2 TaxID=716796 RepID=UPI000D60D633|nr:beta-ketoacyl synthase chain length factor [Azospirillum sp. TSO35-2]PWC36575.1 hypothetical protein TSO352_12340 [Azospirillum sp. TSO35-2]
MEPLLPGSGPAQAGLRFAVRRWSAWTPGRETRAAWRDWAGAPPSAVDEAPPPALPMMLRRRATPLGQRLIAAALACGDGAARARYVLASRHGELGRTLTILESLAAGDPPSPTEFSMSVHHGLAGLLSIHTGNRAGHTALAAGEDSFGFGLLEAAALLAERPGEPVLLLYGDDPLPDAYAAFREDGDAGLPMVCALLLEAGDDILFQAAPNRDGAPPALSAVSDFLRFLLAPERTVTSTGARMVWTWRHHG